MNENITGRKDWFFEAHTDAPYQPDGKVTVILEEEGRRLIRVDFKNPNHVCSHGERPVYYIQKPYINPNTGYGHWTDVHYDRSKNKMIRAFKFKTYE